jgi:uncharacterized protein
VVVAQLDFPKPQGFVSDFAKVIDADTQKRLTALCSQLDAKTHAQIAVVTVESLGGTPIGDYARLLFNKWGIGHKDDNRGMLILLSMTDRMSNITVGYGFERLFPNDRVARIVAEMNPDLKQRNYSKAVLHSTGKIAKIIAHEKGVTLTAFRF